MGELEADVFSALRRLTSGRDNPVLAIACSGGSDSLALLHLSAHWQQSEAPTAKLLAFTVDHGLRPESGAEADFVADFARRLAIPHQRLPWVGQKPETGLQQAARSARYDLLDWAASQAHCDCILTGHTADDQAETVLMRLRQGSGPRGLSGMALYRDLPLTAIGRPLLPIRRSALQDWLTTKGITWRDDPSNDNPDFERVRVRGWLQNQTACGITDALCQSAREFGALRHDKEQAALDWFQAHGRADPAGYVAMDVEAFQNQDRQLKTEILRLVCRAVGGARFAPSDEKLISLITRLDQRQNGHLGQVLWRFDQSALRAYRELRHLPLTSALSADPIIWDGRFVVKLEPIDFMDELSLSGLGEEGWLEVVTACPALKTSPIPHPAILTLPAIRDGKGVCEVPLLGYARGYSGTQLAQTIIKGCQWIGPKTLQSTGFMVA